MHPISNYSKFIREKGRSLSEINPGSNEIALTVSDAFQALDILKNNQIVILGGDILSEDGNGGLLYAYQLWGEEYIYLNWYCDKADDESESDYIKRSCEVARVAIVSANEIAERLKKKCLIVFVI